jgi:hypothetical protein
MLIANPIIHVESQENSTWSEDGSEDNDDTMIQCDPCVVNLDQCSFFLQRGSCCTTPRDLSMDLSPKAPREHQVPWTTLRQVPVNPIAMVLPVALPSLSRKDVPTEVQDDVDDGSTPNTPPFRKRVHALDLRHLSGKGYLLFPCRSSLRTSLERSKTRQT